MNREIKFRGKRIDNGEWVEGYLCQRFNYGDSYLSIQIIGKNLNYHVDPETVGQYTGLKDKNGAEIYEGDIVKNYDEVGIVTFNTNNHADLPAFHLCDKNGESIEYYYGATPSRNDGDSEILGNIHENPELL